MHSPLPARSRRARVLAATTSLATAAAAALAGAVLFAPDAHAGEFLTNGGFELGTVSGWQCEPSAKAVTGQARTGSYALAGTPTSDTAQCKQTVTVSPGTAYTLSSYVKGAYVYLGVDGGASTWTPDTGGGYKQLTVSFTTGANQTSATVYLHGWYGQGTYYADDASLQGPGDPGPGPTDPPSDPPPTDPPPTDPPSSDLPAHALVGYLHASFANGSGYTRMADVPASWDVIDLAFGEPTSATSGDIRFSLCPASDCPNVESEAGFKAAIKAKQAAGKKVLISIGGQNGQVQLTTTAARDRFVESVSAIIDRYGLDGLDIDFEGHSLSLDAGDTDFTHPKTPVVVNLIAALKSLKAKYGSGFVLTMAPETFFVQLGYQFYGPGPNGAQDARAGAYLPVIHALRDDLTLLHVQDYNSGPIMGLDNQYHTMGGADFHIAMTDMLLTGFPVAGNAGNTFPALHPSQVAIGMPASPNAGNGWVSTGEVNKALDCLTKKTGCGGYATHGTWPGLRGLMTWSVNWDKFNGGEFSKNFDGYFGG